MSLIPSPLTFPHSITKSYVYNHNTYILKINSRKTEKYRFQKGFAVQFPPIKEEVKKKNEKPKAETLRVLCK